MDIKGPEVGVVPRLRMASFLSLVVIAGAEMIVLGSFLPSSAGEAVPLFVLGGLEAVPGAVIVFAAGMVVLVAGVATFSRRGLWKLALLGSALAAGVAWLAFRTGVAALGGMSHPFIAGYVSHDREFGLGMWSILLGALLAGIASLGARGPGSRAKARGQRLASPATERT